MDDLTLSQHATSGKAVSSPCFIVVGAFCMHRYHVLVRFNDNNFDNRSVAHENEKADISETVAFTSIAYHSPIMSQILGVHRERHYDEGEGDDVQFHVELEKGIK